MGKTLETVKQMDSVENWRSGLTNSQMTWTFLASSLPPERPIIAWHNSFSFTSCGLQQQTLKYAQLNANKKTQPWQDIGCTQVFLVNTTLMTADSCKLCGIRYISNTLASEIIRPKILPKLLLKFNIKTAWINTINQFNKKMFFNAFWC